MQQELPLNVPNQIPSCLQIGLAANKKGNFEVARQMFRAGMHHLEGSGDKEARLVELMTNVADSYLFEGRYDLAKAWYSRATSISERKHGPYTMQLATLMSRQAEISVLQSDVQQFRRCFESVKRSYLLAKETNASKLVASLMDLSWLLSTHGFEAEVEPVKTLITHIEQLDGESPSAA